MKYNYIIAGAGLSGSIYARILAEKGYSVLILEKRKTIAGNLFDEKDEHGILVQKYGPHIFHTKDEKVFNFIQRFAKWIPFKLRCEVNMCEKSTPSPFNFKTIDQFYPKDKAELIKQTLLETYPNQNTVTIVELLNSTNNIIREYAQMLFDNDYSLYTAKQWGIPAKDININVLKRVPVRLDYEEMYFTDPYECMPENGFTHFIDSILSHPNITVKTDSDALDFININEDKKQIEFNGIETTEDCQFIYTGAIDELFAYCYGQLPYRSLTFKYETLSIDSFQNAPVVAYPQVEGYTRITEYKKLPVQNVSGITTIAYEYPLTFQVGAKAEPYYPIPTETNEKIYSKYKNKAEQISNLVLCGRLAEYKYYNMDQAIASVLQKTNY